MGILSRRGLASLALALVLACAVADEGPEDGIDPEPPHPIETDDGGDDDGPPCVAPAGCPCIYGALDTFVDDDVTMQPQMTIGDPPEQKKRPKYVADIVYPLRGGLEGVPVPIYMNGAESLDGFEARTSGTGTHSRKDKVDASVPQATYKLKFAPSSGIRTRNFEYQLVDTTGTCPVSRVTKKADVYPKWMTFMPILVVLVLCVITQDVFISISAAIWVGSWMLERDAWIGMLRFLDTRLPDGLKDMTIIILFAWLLGGVIGAANKSGGMKALGDKAVVLIKDSFLAQLVVFLFGFVVFMDDYGNTLIVGNNMRPITDRMRLSREKLSFLVDCTSAPIASLTPLSTWISFELGLINQQLDAIGYDDESGFTLFLDSIPKRFYAWFMLAMVLGSILLQRDWGPMYEAETRARKGEGVAPPDPTMTEEDYEEMLGGGVKPKKDIPYRAWNAVVPFFGMVAAFIPLLFYSGARQAPWGGIGWDNSSRNIMGNADSYATLMWLGGFTIMLQVVMYACQYSKETGMLMTPSETVAAAIEGSKDLMEATIVLILASAVGTVVQECMLPDVLIDTIGDSIPGRALPALVFVVGAFIALATGSSWTTMIILFPIAIPLADISSGASKRVLLTNTIAAILGGAVWGDHCSPISDTTVLSAAACRVKTIAHVKTQLPYALLAGTNATLIGYLLNGYGVPAVLLILLGFVFMPAQYYGMSQIPGWGGRTPIYDPEHDKVVGEGLRGSIASIKRNILSCGRVKPDADSFDEKAAAASPKAVGAPPADEEA